MKGGGGGGGGGGGVEEGWRGEGFEKGCLGRGIAAGCVECVFDGCEGGVNGDNGVRRGREWGTGCSSAWANTSTVCCLLLPGCF